MSSLDIQNLAENSSQQLSRAKSAQAPTAPGQSPSATTLPGIPPTGLTMQKQSMDQQYQQQQQGMQQQQQQQGGLQAMGTGLKTGGHGQQGLQDMAEQMARGYGLDFSRGSLVDAEGNFMMTPDQLAGSGGQMDMIAADMNRISQAINDRQVEMQQDKATAALQAGAGLIQARGRGSLAALQSGFYQAMAQNYTDPNLLPEQQDFSFWIQKAGFDEAARNRSGTGDVAVGGGGSGGGGGSSGYTNQGLSGTKGTGGSGGGGGSSGYTNQGLSSTKRAASDKGEIVTSGPHAGQRPVYYYDPINKTTRVSWETP